MILINDTLYVDKIRSVELVTGVKQARQPYNVRLNKEYSMGFFAYKHDAEKELMRIVRLARVEL
jgi:hypothetical protein